MIKLFLSGILLWNFRTFTFLNLRSWKNSPYQQHKCQLRSKEYNLPMRRNFPNILNIIWWGKVSNYENVCSKLQLVMHNFWSFWWVTNFFSMLLGKNILLPDIFQNKLKPFLWRLLFVFYLIISGKWFPSVNIVCWVQQNLCSDTTRIGLWVNVVVLSWFTMHGYHLYREGSFLGWLWQWCQLKKHSILYSKCIDT